MFKPTITDVQDKYCATYHDICPVQNQYKRNHKIGGAAEGRVTSFVVAAAGRHLCILALNRVNLVAVTTIFVLHVGDGRSEHVRLEIMFLAIRALCSFAVSPNVNT